jgi:urease accessory protein
MISLTRKVPPSAATDATVTLTYEQRVRSRLRVTLDDAREAGILLPRGETLKDGDCLAAEDGTIVQVRAAPERLSVAVSNDPLRLARACYHLGNRHIPLQIEGARLAWQHDHVLDDLVRGLGLSVETLEATFEPEPGAYGGSAGEHGHGHGHGHGHHHD